MFILSDLGNIPNDDLSFGPGLFVSFERRKIYKVSVQNLKSRAVDFSDGTIYDVDCNVLKERGTNIQMCEKYSIENPIAAQGYVWYMSDEYVMIVGPTNDGRWDQEIGSDHIYISPFTGLQAYIGGHMVYQDFEERCTESYRAPMLYDSIQWIAPNLIVSNTGDLLEVKEDVWVYIVKKGLQYPLPMVKEGNLISYSFIDGELHEDIRIVGVENEMRTFEIINV
ncbi:hypothetical protein PCE1_001225 [Barthelona sp. PCE]